MSTRSQQHQTELQTQARMLYAHALLVCRALNGDAPDIWEVFPFWTEEEIQAARTEQIKRLLMELHPSPGAGGGPAPEEQEGARKWM